jgi:hypothetical protein
MAPLPPPRKSAYDQTYYLLSRDLNSTISCRLCIAIFLSFICLVYITPVIGTCHIVSYRSTHITVEMKSVHHIRCDYFQQRYWPRYLPIRLWRSAADVKSTRFQLLQENSLKLSRWPRYCHSLFLQMQSLRMRRNGLET